MPLDYAVDTSIDSVYLGSRRPAFRVARVLRTIVAEDLPCVDAANWKLLANSRERELDVAFLDQIHSVVHRSLLENHVALVEGHHLELVAQGTQLALCPTAEHIVRANEVEFLDERLMLSEEGPEVVLVHAGELAVGFANDGGTGLGLVDERQVAEVVTLLEFLEQLGSEERSIFVRGRLVLAILRADTLDCCMSISAFLFLGM